MEAPQNRRFYGKMECLPLWLTYGACQVQAIVPGSLPVWKCLGRPLCLVLCGFGNLGTMADSQHVP
jgi:hypothetical protein